MDLTRLIIVNRDYSPRADYVYTANPEEDQSVQCNAGTEENEPVGAEPIAAVYEPIKRRVNSLNEDSENARGYYAALALGIPHSIIKGCGAVSSYTLTTELPSNEKMLQVAQEYNCSIYVCTPVNNTPSFKFFEPDNVSRYHTRSTYALSTPKDCYKVSPTLQSQILLENGSKFCGELSKLKKELEGCAFLKSLVKVEHEEMNLFVVAETILEDIITLLPQGAMRESIAGRVANSEEFWTSYEKFISNGKYQSCPTTLERFLLLQMAICVEMYSRDADRLAKRIAQYTTPDTAPCLLHLVEEVSPAIASIRYSRASGYMKKYNAKLRSAVVL